MSTLCLFIENILNEISIAILVLIIPIIFHEKMMKAIIHHKMIKVVSKRVLVRGQEGDLVFSSEDMIQEGEMSFSFVNLLQHK